MSKKYFWQFDLSKNTFSVWNNNYKIYFRVDEAYIRLCGDKNVSGYLDELSFHQELSILLDAYKRVYLKNDANI